MTLETRRPIKISAHVAPHHGTFDAMRNTWIEAEELGADAIFTYDHFFPAAGDADGPIFEGWTSLAALAQVTNRAQVGCLVTANSFRNPNLLADMARTIDHISGGRVILGIGSGWVERDYVEYGYEFGTAGDRLRKLESGLSAITERLARLNPLPVQDSLPILIGGGGEKVTLRLVAEYADIWHFFGDTESAVRKASVLDEWMRKLGRHPATIERATDLGEGDVGDLDRLVDAGFTHFTIVSHGPDWDLRFLKEMIDWRDSRG
jgi:probable F420-dependent oxidoreductase